MGRWGGVYKRSDTVTRAAAALVLALVAAPGARAQSVEADENPAFQLSLGYTADLWTVENGRDDGTVYLDNLDLRLDADLERLGWRGASFSVAGLYNNRSQLSETLVGDFQGVSNIDVDGSPRLYELWIEQRLSPSARLKLGIIDLNEEFDVNQTGGLFINSSHGIGPDFSQVGPGGPSIFPAPGRGALVEAGAGGWTGRLGLFEGLPRDPERPRRTVFGLNSGEGALLVAEAERRWEAGRLVVGLRHHSGDFEPWPEPGGAVSADRRGSSGAYLLVEQRLSSRGGFRLDGFGRLGVADGRIHEAAFYAGGGLVLSGPLLGLQEEQLGFAVASAHNARRYRRLVDNGFGAAHETAFELTYSARILPWLRVQPDVQWIVNPGFSGQARDAFAFGLRVAGEWCWSSR